MKLAPVITPDGQPVFSAGGTHAWKVTEHKGYVCSLEWVGNGRRAMPAMVIWASRNVFVPSVDNGMWVISRRCITDFVGFDAQGKCTGSVSEHCLREAREALTTLGKDSNDKAALHALCDVVARFAPDLVHMPVAPTSVRQELDNPPMWEVKAIDKTTGKTIAHTEV
jgi:hypothetical protein